MIGSQGRYRWQKIGLAILQILSFLGTQHAWSQQNSPPSAAPEVFVHSKSLKNSIISSATFSSDGDYVLLGVGDNTVRLWEVKTGTQFRCLNGHMRGVTSVALSPDGRYALSGSWDKTIRLWDLETGEQVHVFNGHTEVITSVEFTPDGRYALSGSWDKTIRLWDLETGEQIRVFAGHIGEIWSVAFSPDGHYIISGGDDGILRLWDLETGEQIRSSARYGHTNVAVSIAFSPDGRYALAGNWNNTLHLWETETGDQFADFAGHTDVVASVEFSPDGRYIISASWDGTLRLWEVQNRRELATFIPLQQGNWITVTTEGYYNKSRDAMLYLSWRFESGVIRSLESFYRPDLVSATLQHSCSNLPDTMIHPIPALMSGEEVRIYFTGRDNRTQSELMQYSWRIDNGDWTFFSRKTHANLGILKVGNHLFEVRSQNAAGNIDPTPEKAVFRVLHQSAFQTANYPEYQDEGEKSRGWFSRVSNGLKNLILSFRSVVVVIGIDEYRNKQNLSYAVRDAEAVALLFRENTSYEVYMKLYNGEATKKSIVRVIDELINERGIDRIIFYFAGHGHTEKSVMIDGELGFFLPTDYDPSRLLETSIPMSEVVTWAKSLKARHVLFLFDACFSGMIGSQLRTGRDYHIDFLAENPGRHAIAAGSGEQTTREYKELGHGVFTYFLLEALEGKADIQPKDGILTLGELAIYLQDKVTNYTKMKQHPRMVQLLDGDGQIFIELSK